MTAIAAISGTPAALAAKAATTTIPIVFAIGGDSVAPGLVAGLDRPGGNATGVYFLTTQLEAERLGLLRELVPKATLMAVLLNPTPLAGPQLKEVQAAAAAAGQQINIQHASSESEIIDTAFAAFAQMRAAALLVGADPFFLTRRDHIVVLAARHAIPTIYEQREFAAAGGLAS